MADADPFSIKKLLKGPVDWRNYLKIAVYGICAFIVFSVVTTVLDFLKPRNGAIKSSTTVGKAERVITINKTEGPPLKQGIYVRAASDRASVGVFRETLKNLDVSIGGGAEYEGDSFLEVETRVKF